jgi:hypothetical protein
MKTATQMATPCRESRSKGGEGAGLRIKGWLQCAQWRPRS